MNFRVKAFLVHLSSSATVLGVMLGGLYLGWYRWPGWYVTGAITVTAILVGVDLTLGPLFTLLIANNKKPRRELVRDFAVIVMVQLIALVYGVSTLWIGRPLYYVFWVNGMKVVAASEVTASEGALARLQNPGLAPHWYSTPRWVWAPMPATTPNWLAAPAASVEPPSRGSSAVDDFRILADTVPMPREFKPLSQAGDELRARLQKVDQMSIFTLQERQILKQRMAQRGLQPNAPDALFLSGFGRPLLAVFDPMTLAIEALIPAS
jgi:hypothetical protein